MSVAGEENIHTGSAFTLDRRDSSPAAPVLLKYPTLAIPPNSILARLDHEYEIGSKLNLHAVRKITGRCTWKGRTALEMEFIPGESFKTFFNHSDHRQIGIALPLAISAAEALESLHEAGIVHCDIAASNLLVRSDKQEAVIIDLEFAKQSHGESDFVYSIDGQLPYLAPEQTGRIDLPVDERSDLYALGIVLYEMFTGVLPFQAEDSSGWIHAHLAQQPIAPTQRKASIPLVLSHIILRLLEKIPDNRYQTARGLRRDLSQCLNEWQKHSDIPPFDLGHFDHPGQLRLLPMLYGREREQQQLLAALDQTISGEPQIQFISGFSGIGKTSLVDKLRFPVAAAGGRYISGKFDQTVRALPYAGFAEAFTQLCHQLLAGTPEELESFRNRLLETLGTNAGLILEFLPILENVIGPQPIPPKLDTAETANRFTITLLGFFHCIIGSKQPLVLFLDDIQWADAASLELIYMITTRSVRNHYMIIGAYRNNELTSDHPLSKLIAKLTDESAYINQISLTGLELDQTTALVSSALDMPTEKTAQLAQTIHAKTDGNPFFIRQILETLISEEALFFDTQEEGWHWQPEQIKALDISSNVVELMLRKLSRIDQETTRTLQVASCIGNTFPLSLLSVGAQLDNQTIQQRLSSAEALGLVAVTGQHARFTHDRIQLAVYQSLPSDESQYIHNRLGHFLLGQPHPHKAPLQATQQLNLSLALIDSEEEKRHLAFLNLKAGDAARATMAYDSALDFYSTGEKLFQTNGPTTTELRFELLFHKAEILFYLGDVKTSIENLENLLEVTTDLLSRTRIYQMLIDIHTAELKLTQAMDKGRQALAELGIHLPIQISDEMMNEGVSDIDMVLDAYGDDISTWPEMHDKQALAIVGLLTHLTTPAYISASTTFPVVTLEFAGRALKGGLSRFTCFALSVFGMLVGVGLQRYENALRIGQLATEIAQRSDAEALRARTNFFHAAFIQHWREPLETTLPLFDEGWRIGVETGDLQFASYCINHMHGNGLLAGQSLTELDQSLTQYSDINHIIRQEDGQQLFYLLQRSVKALTNPKEAMLDANLEYKGLKMLALWQQTHNATILSVYHIMRCMLMLILEKADEALIEAQQAVDVLPGLTGMTWVAQHHFLHALALTQAIREAKLSGEEPSVQLEHYRKQFDTWAQHSPQNYLPKKLLIEAELLDLDLQSCDRGQILDAYDAAIDAAADAGRTIDLALACERAAACWLRRDKPLLAGLYLQRTIEIYESWGAKTKVDLLMQRYASQLTPPQPRTSSSHSSSSSDSLHAVDIYSVLKAAQTVAGEFVMDRMLARLIQLVIETAGAQSGFLLLKQDNEWRVVAAQHPDNSSVEVLQWRTLADFPEIASTVINYVDRTQKPVNLDDAAKSTIFAADPSIASRNCRSLLCLPIINRGELAGILYLENNLASHAFTRTHTQVLQLLTTQAISSLEISRYYARVQNLNRSLKEEIEERKRTESKLEFLANHDPLTDLPNRRLFYDRVKHAIHHAARNHSRVAVLFIDLDQFKNINDTLSHQVGDHLLQQVAKRLIAEIREEDTLGRLGGDEFVLLMEGHFDIHDLSNVAMKVLALFQKSFQVDGHDLFPTASLGISLYPDDSKDVDQLLRNADTAMYQAKQQGRNNYCYFSAKLAHAVATRLTLEQDLHRAIERSEFELYYQPQIRLDTGKVTGAEVLLRWNHPSRGLLLPGSFIPIAEENGSIITIGEWVIRQACNQLQSWQRNGIDIGHLAINVSGSQIGPHGKFITLVEGILGEYTVSPSTLELELTESVILQDIEFTMHALEALNNLGIRLAIDDFGTGYSSLSYLHRLPVQRLKIDRSFVMGIPHARDSAMIIQSILLLGQNLGKEIIAEGIEHPSQHQFLLEAGCPEGQGFLFGAPMPLAAFDKLLV
ncbi:MAG: EAL domain-containing protein [Candidatus Thiodiazotropha sp.]